MSLVSPVSLMLLQSASRISQAKSTAVKTLTPLRHLQEAIQTPGDRVSLPRGPDLLRRFLRERPDAHGLRAGCSLAKPPKQHQPRVGWNGPLDKSPLARGPDPGGRGAGEGMSARWV